MYVYKNSLVGAWRAMGRGILGWEAQAKRPMRLSQCCTSAVQAAMGSLVSLPTQVPAVCPVGGVRHSLVHCGCSLAWGALQ